MASDATDDQSNLKPDWIELAKIAQDSFQNRRALEWKLAFGFWTAIASVTAVFLLNSLDRPDSLPYVLAVGYVVAFLLSVLCWKIPLQVAHAEDKEWWRYYLDRAQGGTMERPTAAKTVGESLAKLPVSSWFWLVGQTLFTVTFLVLSWYAIAFIAPTANTVATTAQEPLQIDVPQVTLTPTLIGNTGPWVAVVGIIGIISTFSVGIATLVLSRATTAKTSFVNTVTSERIKWLGTVRDNIARIFALIEKRMAMSSDRDPTELQREVDQLIVDTRLRLNLNDAEDKALAELLTRIPIWEGTVSTELRKNLREEVIAATQAMLKREWEKVKDESIHGDLRDRDKSLLDYFRTRRASANKGIV